MPRAENNRRQVSTRKTRTSELFQVLLWSPLRLLFLTRSVFRPEKVSKGWQNVRIYTHTCTHTQTRRWPRAGFYWLGDRTEGGHRNGKIHAKAIFETVFLKQPGFHLSILRWGVDKRYRLPLAWHRHAFTFQPDITSHRAASDGELWLETTLQFQVCCLAAPRLAICNLS